MNADNHFSLLASSHENQQQQSGGLTAIEDIGAQIQARHLLVSDALESSPVLGINENLVAQPFGDRLLAEFRSAHELPEFLGERRLAARDFDGALESGNVRFIHNHPRYTTMVVDVNDHGSVTGHNESCTVLHMPARMNKAVADKGRIREAARGPDGRTFGERLDACIKLRARQLGQDKYTQEELITDATRAIGRDPAREDERVLGQQGVSLILNNKVSESPAAIAFALVFGVEPAWLQYGIGEPTILNRLLAEKK